MSAKRSGYCRVSKRKVFVFRLRLTFLRISARARARFVILELSCLSMLTTSLAGKKFGMSAVFRSAPHKVAESVKTLRILHLYLGCIFAPMLVFFAVSGIWQQFGAHWGGANPSALQSTLSLLSTLHTGRGLKSGANLSSWLTTTLVVAMATSFLLTIVLGVIMALRFGHKKTAIVCLLCGILLPILACLVTATA